METGMIVLGLETSCDETAVAVLEIGAGEIYPPVKILSNRIASQHEVHLPYGGIFPELASRRHIEVIRPLVTEGLKIAGIGLEQIDGVAVTSLPGLVGSLLVGVSFAKALAFGRKIPFIGVNHLEGHLNAPLAEGQEVPYPHIGLIVSGGHTALYEVKKFGDYRFLGGTRDDAAGEAFDKVAKLLGLGYPGGPIVDREARKGNAGAYPLTKPKLPGYEISFSGLKTAVRSLIEKNKNISVPDLCASFQETAVDVLAEKTRSAANELQCKAMLVTGGVACNSRLREKLKEAHFASPVFSTDNAAMIAYVGGRYLQQGKQSPLSLNAAAHAALERL